MALSEASRILTYVVAVLFVAWGGLLFVAPGWAATSFAWDISPFVAMTMGGWYLGAGVMAFVAARVWRWPAAYALLIFAWTFGILEGVLLVIHRDVLMLSRPLALPYIVVLAVASLATIVGILDWMRKRPAMIAIGPPQPWWIRTAEAVFVVYVLALVYLLIDGVSPDGRIWPGPLTLLTARAFAAFFFSLAFAVAWLFFARGLGPVLVYMQPAIFLAAIIEVVAIVFTDRFDFVNKPGGLLYHASYIGAVIGASIIVLYCRAKRVTVQSDGTAEAVR
jgi:hypothetical protein